jgi:serine/threonine protein kinase
MDLNPGDSLPIGKRIFVVSPHPGATANIAYAQEGRKSIVYQVCLQYSNQLSALKVFKKAYRGKYVVHLSNRLRKFAVLPGMQACKRTVLTAKQHSAIIHTYPDLEYTVLMPWVNGNTWFEMLLQHQSLTVKQSYWCARRLAFILTALEARNIAHCDLSGANLVIDLNGNDVQLIDLEDIFAPDLTAPPYIPGGTFGYQHKTCRDGQWNSYADRFAGAVLLSEILCGHLESIQRACWGESYFAPDELQNPSCERYLLMNRSLQIISPALAKLLQQAWTSPHLKHCPPLSQWFEEIDLLEHFNANAKTEHDTPYIFGAYSNKKANTHTTWAEYSLLEDWDPSESVIPLDVELSNSGEEILPREANEG